MYKNLTQKYLQPLRVFGQSTVQFNVGSTMTIRLPYTSIPRIADKAMSPWLVLDETYLTINSWHSNFASYGREPWSSGYGRDSCSKGRGIKSQHRILDGHFSFICCKNCNVCLKKTKINENEAWGDPLIFCIIRHPYWISCRPTPRTSKRRPFGNHSRPFPTHLTQKLLNDLEPMPKPKSKLASR